MKLRCLICGMALPGLAMAAALQPEDFAFGVRLETPVDAAVYRLDIPEVVYQNSQRPDLGDMRVFNNNKQVVPHMLQRPARPDKTPQPAVTVPLFPLYRDTQSSGQSFSLQVKTAADGAIVNIDRSAAAMENELSGYLLDLSQIEQAADKLTLHWAQPAASLITTVRVQASDNLTDWRTIVAKQTLADLEYAGQRLANNEISLPRSRTKYLRLDWDRASTPITLDSVRLHFPDTEQDIEWQWRTLEMQSGESGKAIYEYDSKGVYPVEQFNVILPQRNTLLPIKIYSRAVNTSGWQLRWSGHVYNLSINSNELRNRDVSVSLVTDRYWRLEVSEDNGNAVYAAPLLSLGWRPHQLTFVAQGEGPFSLGYGSSHVGPASSPVQAMLADLQRSGGQQIVQPARIGRHIVYGGESKLLPEPEPWPWKKIILWLVLISVVIILGIMAHRLYKEMQPKQT